MEIIKAGEKSSSSSSNEACFECKICLQLADQDPVVTRCGHLFCWPCLHRWLSICSSHSDRPHCPVCRSIIKEKKVIPIYGIGKLSLDSDVRRVGVPNRPSLHCSNRVSSSFRRTRNAIAAVLNSIRHHLSRLRGYMPLVLGDMEIIKAGEKSSSSSSNDACFECKICLQLADQDPIVTRCGHLFCWPCLHRWLSMCSSHSNRPHCPVCRSIIKEKKVIPIYGIGKSSLHSDARRVGTPDRPSLHCSNRVSSSFRRTRIAIAAVLNSNRRHLSRLRGYMPLVLGGVGLVVLGGFVIWVTWEVVKAMELACDAFIGVLGAMELVCKAIIVVMYPVEAVCNSIVRIRGAMETLFLNFRKVGEFIENGGWEKVKSNWSAELLDIVFYE